MKLVVKSTPSEADAFALSVFEDIAGAKPECSIGYPTGRSVDGLYALVRAASAQGRLDLSRTRAFQLDDYLGIPLSHSARFAQILREQVLAPCGLAEGNIHLFPEDERFGDAEAAAYEALLASCGLDLLLLGVGANGHVGFNEPSERFSTATHRVTLTEVMRRDAAGSFGSFEEAPRYAATMGMQTIARAHTLILIAQGEKKADAIARLFLGKADPACPVSALKDHPDFWVIVDDRAAGKLPASVIRKGKV